MSKGDQIGDLREASPLAQVLEVVDQKEARFSQVGVLGQAVSELPAGPLDRSDFPHTRTLSIGLLGYKDHNPHPDEFSDSPEDLFLLFLAILVEAEAACELL